MAGGAALADGPPLGEGVDVRGLGTAGAVDVVEAGLGDDAGDGVGEVPVVRDGPPAPGSLVRFEAGDVGDGAGAFGGPADAYAHAGADGVGAGRVEGVQEGGVRSVELDQHPGEGGVQGLLGAGAVVPRPGGDGTGGADLDELADLLGGDGVVFDGRDHHLAVGGLHPEDDALAQPGEEGALDGPEGPGEGELDDEGRAEHLRWGGSCHGDSPMRSIPVISARPALVQPRRCSLGPAPALFRPRPRSFDPGRALSALPGTRSSLAGV